MSKNILVLLKIYKGDLNPFDECALECALSYPNSKVIILSMSPLSNLETLENLTRLGCNAILISDKIYAGSDTIATSEVLAKAISLINPDLIFAGRQSIDGNTAQVPIMLSELTNYKLINKVISFKNNKVITRNNEEFLINNKQILTFEKFKLLRSPSMFSKKSPVQIWDNSILKLDENLVGFKGSPTQVLKTYSNESDRRFCKFINYDELDRIIDISLNKKIIVKEEKINKIPLIHYVGNLKDVSEKYAEKSEEIEVEGLSIDELIKKISLIKPKLILWEENKEYKELAARVAIKIKAGLCADCISFNYQQNKVVMTRPALGGDIIADIISTSDISMASVRATTKNDELISITIGKGALPYIENVKSFAKKYNANIYCSRPLADAGVIDYSKQVGLTGINIVPKVCISIGTSGAIQHVVGINKSQTIIAININKKEKIFDYADYGIVMDAKNI